MSDREPVHLAEADVAADLGAIDPAAVPSVNRPDGRPGLTESYAGAQLVELEEQQDRLRLRGGDQPLPTDGNGSVIHELVVADLMNRLELGKKRYGQPLRAWNGRDVLKDIYDEILDAACYIRQLMVQRDGA